MPSEKQIEAAAKAMETLALERGFVPWDEAASVALTAAEQAEPATDAEPIWFGFDESTGEFTGEYCTVKPHDTRGTIPFVRVGSRPSSSEARLREALVEAEDAMRFVYTSCATFPQEPQHIQNAAWRRIVNALTKARAALKEASDERA